MIQPKRDDDDSDAEAELEEFEARLKAVLEERALRAGRATRPPTQHEADQIAAMAAHARERRPPRATPRADARLTDARSHVAGSAGVSREPVGAVCSTRGGAAGEGPMRAVRAQSRWLVGGAAGLTLVALGAWLGGPWRGTRPAAHGTTEPYLGGSGSSSPAGTLPFAGVIEWDPRGRDGVVRLQVFDAAAASETLVLERELQGREWRPDVPLPTLFRVIVDRPADDGLGSEVVLDETFRQP